jgi:hypothetical protein
MLWIFSPEKSICFGRDQTPWSWIPEASMLTTRPPKPLPWERLGTHCIGDWVDSRAGMDGCRKSRPPLGFDPWTIQAIASCYTDWAIMARCQWIKILLPDVVQGVWIKKWNAYGPQTWHF